MFVIRGRQGNRAETKDELRENIEPKRGSEVRNSSERERQAPQEEWSSDQTQWNDMVPTMAL